MSKRIMRRVMFTKSPPRPKLVGPACCQYPPLSIQELPKGVVATVATCFPRQCGHGPVPMQNRLDRLARLDTELAFDISWCISTAQITNLHF